MVMPGALRWSNAESRILQSVIESVGTKYIDTEIDDTPGVVSRPMARNSTVLDKAQLDQPAGIFDDPFFFDVNLGMPPQRPCPPGALRKA